MAGGWEDEGEGESPYTPLSTPHSSRACNPGDSPRAVLSPDGPLFRRDLDEGDAEGPGYTPLIDVVVSVRVIAFEEAEEFTTFTCQVVLEGHAPYEVMRRYSHFDQLRQLLVRRGHTAIPRLPAKSLFGKLRSAGALRDRSLALDEWLRAVVAHPTVSASQDFLLFLVPGSGLEDDAGFSGSASVAQLVTRPQLNWLQQALEVRFDARVGAVLRRLNHFEAALRTSDARAERAEAEAEALREARRRDGAHARACIDAAARAAVAALSLAIDLEAEDMRRAAAEACGLAAEVRRTATPAIGSHTGDVRSPPEAACSACSTVRAPSGGAQDELQPAPPAQAVHAEHAAPAGGAPRALGGFESADRALESVDHAPCADAGVQTEEAGAEAAGAREAAEAHVSAAAAASATAGAAEQQAACHAGLAMAAAVTAVTAAASAAAAAQEASNAGSEGKAELGTAGVGPCVPLSGPEGGADGAAAPPSLQACNGQREGACSPPPRDISAAEPQTAEPSAARRRFAALQRVVRIGQATGGADGPLGGDALAAVAVPGGEAEGAGGADEGVERAFRKWRMASVLCNLDGLRGELELAKAEMEAAAQSLRARERALALQDEEKNRQQAPASPTRTPLMRTPAGRRTSAAASGTHPLLRTAVTRLMLGMPTGSEQGPPGSATSRRV